MKNKIVITSLAIFLISGSSALARKVNPEKFNKHKEEVISDLTQKRSILDKAISCTKSAKSRADMRNCKAQARSAKKAIREKRKALRKERREKRKAHLQEKLKKIDEKGHKSSQKNKR